MHESSQSQHGGSQARGQATLVIGGWCSVLRRRGCVYKGQEPTWTKIWAMLC